MKNRSATNRCLSSLAHLSHVFRQVIGATPSEYCCNI
jgi:hypothetical protein